MQNYSLLKQEFLKNWIEGLKICNFSGNINNKNIGVLEKKNAIKVSADLAMAFTRRGRTCWSRAVIAKASDRKIALKANNMKLASKRRLFRSKKIMKRSQRIHRANLLKNNNVSHKGLFNSTAKRLIAKRTRVLRRLLPGGDQCVDEVSLMKETLDYIISLKAQIDVMRSCLSATTKLENGN